MVAGTRTGAIAITECSRLAEAWPQAARALRAYLLSRGSRPQDAEDLVQECAVRVLRARPTFVDSADLLRWCVPVVRNLSVDLHRRGLREVSVDCVPDRQCVSDVVEEVATSLELRRVIRALEQLRPSDREAIVGAVAKEQTSLDRRNAVRLNVQRHRARQRLLAQLAALLGICAALGRRLVRVAVPVALPVALAVALLTTVTGGAAGRPAPRSTPGHTSVALRVGESSAATAPDLFKRVHHPRPAASGVRRRSSAHGQGKAMVVAATTPQGMGARLSAGNPRQPGTLVCVRDAEPLPDVCIPQPGPRPADPGSTKRDSRGVV